MKHTSRQFHGLMTRLILVLLLVSLVPGVGAKGEGTSGLARTPVLDAAFSLLEEGNVFLDKYNALTGAKIAARFPLGLPYFFGGRDEELLFKVMEAWQDSGHFKKGRNYIYGYDCIGFTRDVYRHAGISHPPSLTEMFENRAYSNMRLPLSAIPYPEWQNILLPGEMLILQGTYYHVMIYIGTLRDFGFTAQEMGETLFRYSDFPLFIHCSDNPWSIARNRKHIEGLKRTLPIFNTDGGVHVAILGVPLMQAPFEVKVDKVLTHAFEVLGTYLPIYDLSRKSRVTAFLWENRPKGFVSEKANVQGYVELREGMEHPLVKKLKQRLFDLGYYRNNIVNELYTADTAKYIKEVQRVNVLEQTGVATVEFLEFFFSDVVLPWHPATP